MKKITLLPIMLFAIILASCSGGSIGGQVKGVAKKSYNDMNAPSAAPMRDRKMEESFSGKSLDAVKDEAESAEESSETGDTDSSVIIYEADVALSVRSVRDSVQSIIKLAASFNGKVESNASSDSYRSAYLTIRVPVSKFESFLADIRKVGRLTGMDVKATNVSDEYRDLSAKIKAAEKVRERLNGLLKKERDTAERIKILKEIDRVSANIESIRARLEYLKGLADYSTVRIVLSAERQDSVKHYLTSPFPWITALSPGRRSVFGSIGDKLVRPEGYFSLEKDFDNKGPYLFSTPGDRTVIRAGSVENYPAMEISFWKEALLRDMQNRLYRIVEQKEVKNNGSSYYIMNFSAQGGKFYTIAISSADASVKVIEAVYTNRDAFDEQKVNVEKCIAGSEVNK